MNKRKIILFGDSITAGYVFGTMTSVLTDKLRSLIPNYTIMNAGIPGNTTKDALKRIFAHVITYKPAIVVVFFGTNDMSIYKDISPLQFAHNLANIITTIGSSKVILVGPGYIDQKIRSRDRPIKKLVQYQEITKMVGNVFHVTTIDLLQEMLKDPNPKRFLQSDGLHFSNDGYDLLSFILAQAIKNKDIGI